MRVQEVIRMLEQKVFELTKLTDVVDEDLMLEILREDDLLLTFSGTLVWATIYGRSSDFASDRMNEVTKAAYGVSAHSACGLETFYYDPHAKVVVLKLKLTYKTLTDFYSFKWTEEEARQIYSPQENAHRGTSEWAREQFQKVIRSAYVKNSEVHYAPGKHVDIKKLWIKGQSLGRFIEDK